MKIDLHCHTKYSLDNDFEPEKLIWEAYEKGLDGVCITEHFSVEASRPVEDIEKPAGFLVFRGVEISTNKGHMLAFGLEDDSWNTWCRNHSLDMIKVVTSVKASGGICVPSHPYRGIESMADSAFDPKLFDAAETINGANLPQHNEQAQKKAQIVHMPQTGGSDCHGPGQVGRAYTLFENQIASLSDLVKEIKQGRCRPVRM